MLLQISKYSTGAINCQENFGYKAIFNGHAVFSIVMKNKRADHVKAVANQIRCISLLKCRQLKYMYAVSPNRKIPNVRTESKKQEKT